MLYEEMNVFFKRNSFSKRIFYTHSILYTLKYFSKFFQNFPLVNNFFSPKLRQIVFFLFSSYFVSQDSNLR